MDHPFVYMETRMIRGASNVESGGLCGVLTMVFHGWTRLVLLELLALLCQAVNTESL